MLQIVVEFQMKLLGESAIVWNKLLNLFVLFCFVLNTSPKDVHVLKAGTWSQSQSKSVWTVQLGLCNSTGFTAFHSHCKVNNVNTTGMSFLFPGFIFQLRWHHLVYLSCHTLIHFFLEVHFLFGRFRNTPWECSTQPVLFLLFFENLPAHGKNVLWYAPS